MSGAVTHPIAHTPPRHSRVGGNPACSMLSSATNSTTHRPSPRRRPGPSRRQACGLPLKCPHAGAYWVPASAGMTIEGVDGPTTRTLRSTDRLSRPTPTAKPRSTDAQSCIFTVRLWSSVVQKRTNPFRPLSEISAKLSPRSRVGIDSLHRRTNSEIMTSDWCSEAGWGRRRFPSGQAGKV